MNRNSSHHLYGILVVYLILVIMLLGFSGAGRSPMLSGSGHSPGKAGLMWNLAPSPPGDGNRNPSNKTSNNKDQAERTFIWVDPARIKRITVFSIPLKGLKKEVRRFGINPALPSDSIQLRRGAFKIAARHSYFHNRRIMEKVFTIIDYPEVFKRNASYFNPLCQRLSNSAGLTSGDDPLYPFLSFVQYIKYGVPPEIYNGRFINKFFLPLLCLYEGYGDCDTKALLLAEFLNAFPGLDQRVAIVLVRGNGLSHALLAIHRKPLLGMTSLFFYRDGYYVVLETTKPGWSPGFISRNVLDTLKAGLFEFVKLN